MNVLISNSGLKNKGSYQNYHDIQELVVDRLSSLSITNNQTSTRSHDDSTLPLNKTISHDSNDDSLSPKIKFSHDSGDEPCTISNETTLDSFCSIALELLESLSILEIEFPFSIKSTCQIQMLIETILIFVVYPQFGEAGKSLSKRINIQYDNQALNLDKESVTRFSDILLNFSIHSQSTSKFTMKLYENYLIDLYAILIIHVIEGPTIEHDIDSPKVKLKKLFSTVPSIHSLPSFLALINHFSHTDYPIHRKLCSFHLNMILSRKDGLIALISSAYDPNNTTFNQDINHIFYSIISTLKDTQLDSIANQLFILLMNPPKSTIPYQTISSNLSITLFSISRPTFMNLIFKPIVSPLIFLFGYKTDLDLSIKDLSNHFIYSNEETILSSLESLYMLMNSKDLSSLLSNPLTPIMYNIYFMLQFTIKHSISSRTLLENIMDRYIIIAESNDLLNFLVFIGNEFHDVFGCLDLSIGQSRQLIIITKQTKEQNIDDDSQLNNSNSIPDTHPYFTDISIFIQFLPKVNHQVTTLFFIHLLKMYSIKGSTKIHPSLVVLMVQIISFLIDFHGPTILSQKGDIISFIKSILNQNTNQENELDHHHDNENTKDNQDDTEDDSSISMALILLKSLFTQTSSFTLNEWEELDDIVIILHTIKPTDNTILLLIKETILLITQSRLIKNPSLNQTPIQSQTAKLFQESLLDLKDDLEPVRAYGLCTLNRLIEQKDLYIIPHIETLTLLFLDQLKNDDSFVFLNAIKCLTNLTNQYGIQPLEIVLQKYADPTTDTLTRLKIAEHLVKTIDLCGETYYKYATRLNPILFKTLYDPIKQIITSCLSILQSVSDTEPTAFNQSIEQLMDYIYHLYLFETDHHVKRCVTRFLYSVFNGNHSISYQTLKRIRVFLEFVLGSEDDSVCFDNIKSCLEIL